MQPRQLVRSWVEAFNRADADALAGFYSEDAINHQMPEAPVNGRAAIRDMFAAGFAHATMVCIVENLFEDGEWAILEWRDPLGLAAAASFMSSVARSSSSAATGTNCRSCEPRVCRCLKDPEPAPACALPHRAGPIRAAIHRLKSARQITWPVSSDRSPNSHRGDCS
jgi:hypothetical protein